MQLLPLVEMYCKWELEEDCTSLRALMLRFDSESELECHELGRSLLFMVRDDDVGAESLPQRAPILPTANPFDVVRERLAAADMAIQALNLQVKSPPQLYFTQMLVHANDMLFHTTFPHTV